MKKCLRWLVVATVICSGSYLSAASSDYYIPSDYDIVNQIHNISYLTKKDEDRWKLAWLGSLQNIITGAAGLYATYEAGAQSYGIGEQVSKSLTESTETFKRPGLLETYLSETFFNALATPRVWAIAGALGVGFGAYKILNPRLERGIIAQVKTFADMCSNFTVATTIDINWASLGTRAGESMWARSSNIAREKGIADLIEQAGVALALLDQLKSNPEIEELRRQIGGFETNQGHVKGFKENLEYNHAVIVPYANGDLHAREIQYQKRGEFAKQEAERKLAEEKASALKVGKISLAFTALGKFFKGSLETLVYINENKEKIAGGFIAAILLPYFVKKAWDVQTVLAR